jgi:putative transposase
MGRALRTDVGGYVYHVLNRANGRAQIFETDKDYQLFESVLEEARDRTEMRILAYEIMPNHWHLVLYPKKDGDVTKFMGWFTLTHTQRVHSNKKTIGHGHLYQGRYKSFLCQDDSYFLQLVRYVERNALRAGLVKKAQDWRWSSVWRREYGTKEQKKLLSQWPVEMPMNYSKLLNLPQSEKEENSIRNSMIRGSPYGGDSWVGGVIKKFGLEITMRKRGRPKKGS